MRVVVIFTSKHASMSYVILFNWILGFLRGILSKGVINCGIVIPPETMISVLHPRNTMRNTKIREIKLE